MSEILLFVHGGPGMECAYLKPWFAPLSADYDLEYYDQRGSTLRALQGELAGQLERFSAPVTVVAHSWGSFLLLSALRDGAVACNILKAAILIAPMPLTDERAAQGMATVRGRFSDQDARQRDDLAMDLENNGPAFLELVTPYYHYDRTFRLGSSGSFDAAACQAVNREIKGYDLRNAVRHLPCRTMLIYGAADYSQPEPEYHDMERHIIEKAGHYVFAERQAETLQLIRAFLE